MLIQIIIAEHIDWYGKDFEKRRAENIFTSDMKIEVNLIMKNFSQLKFIGIPGREKGYFDLHLAVEMKVMRPLKLLT